MNISKPELLEALAKLDVTSDADWTSEGLPSIERVRDLAFDDSITREDLTSGALGFDRDVAKAALVAKTEVTADDATRLEAAKPLAEASKDATAAVEQLNDAPSASLSVEERRQELQAKVDAAKEDIAAYDEAIQRARTERDKMVLVLDQAVKDLEHEFPPLRHADVVQQWLASEAQKRMDRNGAPSDLDRRFMRPMGYGNRRPSVPPVASHA